MKKGCIKRHKCVETWKKVTIERFQLSGNIWKSSKYKDFGRDGLTDNGSCEFELGKTQDPNTVENQYILIERG